MGKRVKPCETAATKGGCNRIAIVLRRHCDRVAKALRSYSNRNVIAEE